MVPKPLVPNNQISPQPGTTGQLSKRQVKYLSMEYITLYLKSTEYGFLRELSNLIQTSENACGMSCITNLPDATFVFFVFTFVYQPRTHILWPVNERNSRKDSLPHSGNMVYFG